MSRTLVESTVSNFFHRLPQPAHALLIAVSGGSDSVALLSICHHLRTSLGIERVGVVHVNHGLRPEAAEEEALVTSLCLEIGCACHIIRLSGRSLHDSGVEAWAREQRYLGFAHLCRDQGYDYTATGHTADDQAETLLLNILRGTGLNGLSGIQPVRRDQVVRPVLALRRRQLQEWLNHNGIRWLYDPSNDDLRFRRNRIRHALVPLLEEINSAAVTNLCALQRDAEAVKTTLQPLLQAWETENIRQHNANSFAIRREPAYQFSAIAAEALIRILPRFGISPRRILVERLLAGMNSTAGTILLANGWQAHPCTTWIECLNRAELDRLQTPFCLPLSANERIFCPLSGKSLSLAVEKTQTPGHYGDPTNTTVWMDAAICGTQLVYRSIHPADQFIPLGSDRAHNLINYLKKQGLNQHSRLRTGVVSLPDGPVVWIPGVAISQRCRISPATHLRVRLSCSAEPALSFSAV